MYIYVCMFELRNLNLHFIKIVFNLNYKSFRHLVMINLLLKNTKNAICECDLFVVFWEDSH